MIDTQERIRIGIDEASNRVYLELPGPTSLIPWEVAKQIALTLLAKAQECEQIHKRKQIVMDGAILHRAGVPVGLTNNHKLQKDIIQEAKHGIGRKVPSMGIPSNAAFGVPGLKSTPPRKP